MKLEQAEFRNLLKENTDDTKAIKADTAELLEAFYSSMLSLPSPDKWTPTRFIKHFSKDADV